MTFSEKLSVLRVKAGLSQGELADALDVTRQTVSRWELGLTLPDIDKLLALSRLFGVSLDFLVNDDIASELDTPIVKQTRAVLKMSYRFKTLRLIILVCIAAAILIIGIATNSLMNSLVGIVFLGLICLIYLVVKLILLAIARLRDKEK